MATPDPAIAAAIAKLKASGGSVAPVSVSAQAMSFGALAAQGGQQTQETTIPVWRSTHKVTQKRVGAGGEESFAPGLANTTPDQFGANDASTQFGVLLADQKQMAEWSKIALRAGLISPDNVNDAAALGRAWDTAIGWAVNIKAASRGNTEVTPFEAAKMVAANTGSALIAQQKYAEQHFTGNRSSTTTNIDKSTTSQTGDILRQMLGRNPTAGEQAAYQHGINQTAAANPTTVTSVDTLKDGKVTGTVNTKTGGYDEQAAAIQSASSASPEVARNQQATTFYDALVRAIGAAV